MTPSCPKGFNKVWTQLNVKKIILENKEDIIGIVNIVSVNHILDRKNHIKTGWNISIITM